MSLSFSLRNLFLVAAVALALPATNAYVFNSAAPKWPHGTITFHLNLGTSPTLLDGGTWNSNAIAAMQEWNANMSDVQFDWVAESGTSGTAQNIRNETYFGADAYGQAFDVNTLAITVTWYNSTARVESDIVFNSSVTFDAYRGALRPGPAGKSLPDFRRVILHELGHVLGFSHDDSQGIPSIMVSRITDLDHLSDDDKVGLVLSYGLGTASVTLAPIIATQPVAVIANTGDPVSFNVAVLSATAVTYQWRKDGAVIGGATSSTYTIASASSANAGSYTVVATNSAGATTSSAVTLTVNTPLTPQFTLQPNSTTVTVGSPVSFTTAVSGNNVQLQWYKNNVAIAGATLDHYNIAAAAKSDAGDYKLVATNTLGTATSSTATLTVNDVPVGSPSTKIVNISTRSFVGTGGDVMIAGFILGGSGQKTVLIRASGPALAQFNVSGLLADPTIELHDATKIIGTNDNWGDDTTKKAALVTAFQSTGFAFADGSKDAAILATLPAGGYTAIVSGKNNTTGVALIEVYEMDPSNYSARLINISTRSLVKTDGDVQIAGFVINGPTAKRVLIRASGPALTQYGVPGVLADPVMNVYSGNTVIATNDDWGPALKAEFIKNGVDNWTTGSKDAAVVLTLTPGPYTAIVSGKNATTGDALIEVFEDD